MNKKLRLLLTTRCPNKCPMCCNNLWDFSQLPVVERWDYEQIMFTGGEPLLYLDKHGIVLTPHSKESAEAFKKFNASTVLVNNPLEGKSLRLNLFPDIKEYLKDEDLSGWQVKDMQWIKDCPVPEGEDFRRVALLW